MLPHALNLCETMLSRRSLSSWKRQASFCGSSVLYASMDVARLCMSSRVRWKQSRTPGPSIAARSSMAATLLVENSQDCKTHRSWHCLAAARKVRCQCPIAHCEFSRRHSSGPLLAVITLSECSSCQGWLHRATSSACLASQLKLSLGPSMWNPRLTHKLVDHLFFPLGLKIVRGNTEDHQIT